MKTLLHTLTLSVLSTIAFASTAYATTPNILSVTVYSEQLPRTLHQDVPMNLCKAESAWVSEWYDAYGKLLERRYMGCDYRPGLNAGFLARQALQAEVFLRDYAAYGGSHPELFQNGFDGTCHLNRACSIKPKKE